MAHSDADTFHGFLVTRPEGGQQVAWTAMKMADLMPGDVEVAVSHTTINYKDGLGLTGKGPIFRKVPLVPGIDFAGTVTASSNSAFAVGDSVILNGWGVGETHSGGYAERARVQGDWLVKKPAVFSAAQTMAIGTAGYTAMLCVMALEAHDITPASGPILVTGAAGGVGSVAVAILAKLGFQVAASTGRPEEAEFLKSLGATDILNRADFAGPAKPLGRERFGGVIDVAGSTTLANAISQTKYGGCVAACGLTQGMDLPASVAPFILRGVTLVGIDSVMCPKPKRIAAWNRLAMDLDLAKLDALTVTHPLRDVIALAPQIIAGHIRGRVVLTVA